MANKRRGNHNKQRNKKSKNNRKDTEVRLKPSFIPQSLTEGIVIFDEDPFFSQFIDIILYGLNVKKEAVRILNNSDLTRFKKIYSQGDYSKNIYFVDELFLSNKIDIPGFIGKLKEYDSEATIVGCTAVGEGDINDADMFDRVVVKSRKNNELTIGNVLANLLGIDLENAKEEEE